MNIGQKDGYRDGFGEALESFLIRNPLIFEQLAFGDVTAGENDDSLGVEQVQRKNLERHPVSVGMANPDIDFFRLAVEFEGSINELGSVLEVIGVNEFEDALADFVRNVVAEAETPTMFPSASITMHKSRALPDKRTKSSTAAEEIMDCENAM
jgi:hypothetical protein